ncbi:MAG: serine--tRNA ligase [Thermoguttaceae bacterium]|nr:serine--tRNA ligase [Thermoguttaceae bacterium]
MLDRKWVVANVEIVKQNNQNRGVKADVDRVVELEEQRKQTQIELDQLNCQANEVAKTIGKAKDSTERDARKEEGRALRAQADEVQKRMDEINAEQDRLLREIPNLTHPSAPIGMEPTEVAFGKTPIRKLDFKPLDHVELAAKHDLIDFDSGAKTSGHGFYFLKNEGVLLELALQRYALGILMDEGFTLTTTPDLARNEILQGIGFIPRGPETQIYSIDNTDLSLVATAEITLGGMFSSQTIDIGQLPIKICGISHCFRTEAGAHGRESRGIYRVHQFTKVEMFAYTKPEESEAMLENLRRIECRIFDGLEVPYRVIDTPTGDLGGPAYRKYDLEAWMPGRDKYGEVTSTSNCTDYQARRLDIRFRTPGEKGTQYVHTLNGTAVAISRALIAVLENHQQADGTIRVPDVLQKWVGKELIGK